MKTALRLLSVGAVVSIMGISLNSNQVIIAGAFILFLRSSCIEYSNE